MAQKKRPSPLDEPPTASSSESEQEDQQPSSQKHEEEEVAASSEEEDEEASTEEDDDEEEENRQPASSFQPASKNPPPPPTNSHPKPSSSESATESDSGTESESEPDPPPPGAANPKVKPLASKPMEQTPKARSQPSAAASVASARSGSKRPSAENNMHETDPKRSKKKLTVSAVAVPPSDKEVEEDGKKSGDDSKKLFQRIWSEEDEIAILKGMVEFTSKTGMDPFKQVNEFHDFVKKSLHVDASINQLKEKIRRLKKKYETNAGKGKNGEGPKFSKAHEQKSFELSKKVWANIDGGVANGAVEKTKSNGKTAKNLKEGSSSRNVSSPEKSKPETKPETNLPLLDSKPDKNLALSEMLRFGKSSSLFGLNEEVIKGGLELMGASQRTELEVRWNKLQIAELELFAKRAQLIEDQARLILEAYKSSDD